MLLLRLQLVLVLVRVLALKAPHGVQHHGLLLWIVAAGVDKVHLLLLLHLVARPLGEGRCPAATAAAGLLGPAGQAVLQAAGADEHATEQPQQPQ